MYQTRNNNLTFLRKIGSVYVYENKKVLDRAFFIPVPSNDKKVGTVNLIEKSEGYYLFRVTTPYPQTLFLSETYESGWHAFINNEETKISKTNINFQSVGIPKGEHFVRFIYRPNYFYLSLVLSVTAILLTVLFLSFKYFLVNKGK